jgi:lysozyme
MKPNTSRIKTSAKVAVAVVALVGAWEGLRTVAYRDPVGIPTVCFGETRGVKMGDRYTAAECKEMLGNRLQEFESGIRKCLRNPDAVPDGAYVASISLAYNIGVGAFCNSSVRKRLDAGWVPGACDAFRRFVYAKGIKLPGLVNRREAERKICLKETL